MICKLKRAYKNKITTIVEEKVKERIKKIMLIMELKPLLRIKAL